MSNGALGIGFACWLAAVGAGRWRRVWLALVLAGACALAAASIQAFQGVPWEWRSTFDIGGERLHLRLDALSAWFVVLVALVGAAGAVYAIGYWPDRAHPSSARRGRVWWGTLLVSMSAVLVCSNGLHFLLAWEAFALSAYFLITLERDRREVRAAGWLYLAASHAGTMCLFAFFALLAVRTGSWDLGPARARADLAPLFWLALLGFGVKAGFFPLHVWLPSAHGSAPSHVSAVMSGVAIKMGIYGMARFAGWLPPPSGAGWVMLSIGAATAVLGAALALAQNDLKRLLAYCSVENIGVILVGLGAAILASAQGGSTWAHLALAGALLHVWNHGIIKSLLFFGAGSVLHATGTREMSRLGGLWRTMPWTAGFFALGSAAVCSLPPLNGFVGEWLIYAGLFESAAARSGVAVVVPATIALAVTGALCLAAFVKAGAVVFLGSARTQPAARAHECSAWMRAPMLALAASCLVLALAPTIVWGGLESAMTAWDGNTVVAHEPGVLSGLARGQQALAALGVLLVALAWRRSRVRDARRAPTWDCGYARPAARMQYTAGSFATIASGWLPWLLRPWRRLRRPRGTFPSASHDVQRVQEPVLERVLRPVSNAVMFVSAWVRRRQHGRLQDYILYLFTGLFGLSLAVLAGGRK